jgi:hypothetical protein
MTLYAPPTARFGELGMSVSLPISFTEADNATASSELSVDGGSSADIFSTKSTLRNCGQLNTMVPYTPGRNVRPDLVGDDHEHVVKIRRAVSYRYPVNRIAV